INNKCGWVEWFTAANKSLELRTGLSRQGINKCRNGLKQRGVIDFKSNGTCAASYHLVAMSYSSQARVQDSVQAGVQAGSTLNKPKPKPKPKLKDDISPISPDAFADYAGDNADLLAALSDFADMRQSMKRPLSARAKELLVAKLSALTSDKKVAIAILNQSVLNNWQGVFPIDLKRTSASKNDALRAAMREIEN
ncbi:MAG: hypothetical protein RSA70_07085, partial [Clostridia bacterium]